MTLFPRRSFLQPLRRLAHGVALRRLAHLPRLAPGVGPRALALPLAGALSLGACGEAPRTVDAQAAPSTQSAEVSIRFDVSGGHTPTVQVLAFRATTTAAPPTLGVGVSDWRPDVLGIVDPLAATAPEQGCALGDLDVATSG